MTQPIETTFRWKAHCIYNKYRQHSNEIIENVRIIGVEVNGLRLEGEWQGYRVYTVVSPLVFVVMANIDDPRLFHYISEADVYKAKFIDWRAL